MSIPPQAGPPAEPGVYLKEISFSAAKKLFSSIRRKVQREGIASDPEEIGKGELPGVRPAKPKTGTIAFLYNQSTPKSNSYQSINLQPTKLMAAESQGMILAAGGPDGVILATFEKEAKVGSKVR